MSIHPSFKRSSRSKRHRSVLKRFERLKTLFDKEEWEEGKSIFGLPKIKILKLKIKKEKAAEVPAEGEVAATEGVAEGATPKAADEKAEGATPKKEETKSQEKPKK